MALIDALFIITAWLDETEIEHAMLLEMLKIALAQILSTVGLSPKVQSCLEIWQILCRAEWMWHMEEDMSRDEARNFDWRVGNVECLSATPTWKSLTSLKRVWFIADFTKKFPKVFFTMMELCAVAKLHGPLMQIEYREGVPISAPFIDCLNVLEDVYEILCCRPPLPAAVAVERPLSEDTIAVVSMEEDPVMEDDALCVA